MGVRPRNLPFFESKQVAFLCFDLWSTHLHPSSPFIGFPGMSCDDVFLSFVILLGVCHVEKLAW